MSDESEPSPHPYRGVDEDAITNIARTMSRQSFQSLRSDVNEFVNVFEDHDDPALDPTSGKFDARKWLKNMRSLYRSDPDRYPTKELGVSFRNLGAYGHGQDTNFQTTVANVPIAAFYGTKELVSSKHGGNRVQILHKMDGVINPGEMLVVLGRPGSGCSTFLRTIASQTYGFSLDEGTEINYCGLTPKQIATRFRGDVVYCGESELHLPQLSVGDTLMFAARMKTPAHIIPGVTREEYALHMRNMIMATYGLSHTVNTRVGNDLIRGVSGGERKRVSIAELALCGSQLQCWDNSTRGLDSATALEFVRSLRNSSDIFNVTSAVAVYQASEEMYECFDKAIVLYEGMQIFYGPIHKAKDYFMNMGWQPKPRQPTPDFLTSLSSPNEREAKPGWEDRVPRTAAEFRERWINSPEYAELLEEIEAFNQRYNEKSAEEYAEAYRAHQSKKLPKNAAYTVSYNEQLKALVIRGFQALKGDPTMPATGVIGNLVMGFIVSSMFYNMQNTTQSFFSRNALIFFSLLYNGMNTLLEIFALYAVRPIVQKHQQYALYHPTLDAAASLVTSLPQKVIVSIGFNVTIYFISNLRREPGNFFFFLLIAFVTSLMTSHLFRTIGSATSTFTEAMVPANMLLLALIIFTGFVVPVNNMHGWCRWINYINPLAYSFEALMANEYHNRRFTCSVQYPTYGSGISSICSVAGAVAGEDFVDGDRYIETAYEYSFAHMWRNFGILVGFTIFFLCTYLLLVYVNPGARTKGEVLVYPLSVLRKNHKKGVDLEKGAGSSQTTAVAETGHDGEEKDLIDASDDVFYWKDVCYDIKIKGEPRRLLNYVDGWVKPGTLTALMGASGAGKTTLLDTLANRVTMGVVSGEMYVNGYPRDNTFQRSTGYAMQQDIHLKTATVREALVFSACLRQPFSTPYSEKVKYIDNVLKILEMEPYADAVVGVPGEGLNVEQRKRLTIGVELAAKPKLLLFLDEPTSGLDSQTAWSICQLLKKLSKAGQAVLCTIHQPSALLLQQFDRLLFLARGGRTVYFGDIGENSKTLTGYFEKYDADPCPPDANPAEWMLHVIGAAPGSVANHDYADVWLRSEERQAVRAEIDRLKEKYNASPSNVNPDSEHAGEFAAPLYYQFLKVSQRTFRHVWRSPMYIYSKVGLTIVSSIFNGFTFFKAENTLQGLQNLMFAIFMFTIIINSSIQQHLPNYVEQRDQFEVRERPSKMFSWKVFLGAQFVSEIPWQVLCSVLAFLCWFYPVDFVRNFGDHVANRSGVTYFFVLLFYIFASSLGFLTIAGMGDADAATNMAILLYSMCLLFCGVLATREALPGFWIFMYRISCMTYFIGGMLGNNLGGAPVICADYELLTVTPPDGQTCGAYLDTFLQALGGYAQNPDATDSCQFCTMSNADTFLASIEAEYHLRWRNLGIFIAYPVFNYAAAVFIYWLARVPKKSSRVANSSDPDQFKGDHALESADEKEAAATTAPVATK